MRRPLGKALALATLLGVSSAWATGWAVALHVASHDHGGAAPAGAVPIDLHAATHGHVHPDGTPDHDHPIVGAVAASLPGRHSLLAPAMAGGVAESVADSRWGRRALLRVDSRHDPPPRGAPVSILRI